MKKAKTPEKIEASEEAKEVKTPKIEKVEAVEVTDKKSDEKKLFISEKFDEDKGELFVKIYNEYIRLCRKDNMIDFDDMLYMCRDLLRSRAEIRKMYQGIYKYILIDEITIFLLLEMMISQYMASEVQSLNL